MSEIDNFYGTKQYDCWKRRYSLRAVVGAEMVTDLTPGAPAVDDIEEELGSAGGLTARQLNEWLRREGELRRAMGYGGEFDSWADGDHDLEMERQSHSDLSDPAPPSDTFEAELNGRSAVVLDAYCREQADWYEHIVLAGLLGTHFDEEGSDYLSSLLKGHAGGDWSSWRE